MPALPDRAVARIDASAIEQNCATLKQRLTGDAQLCAVVKADGYGHGAVMAAKAALAGGASWLAVATAEEAEGLRLHNVKAPLLVMGALTHEGLDYCVREQVDFVAWDREFLNAADTKAGQVGAPARVHIKYDSGMGRLGTRDASLVLDLCKDAAEAERLELVGLMTHFAEADDLDSDYIDEQYARFVEVARPLKEQNKELVVHAANSAAVFTNGASHFDMARCGIAIYGLDPFHGDPGTNGLKPALSLDSYVAQVKLIEAGESVGYGRRWIAEEPTYVATAPIGYGDGVRRGLTGKGEALIGGRRYPFAGTVSMDNISIELGAETDVKVGDEVTLIGTQGNQTILTEDLARELDTINYEITCGITPRVRRAYHR